MLKRTLTLGALAILMVQALPVAAANNDLRSQIQASEAQPGVLAPINHRVNVTAYCAGAQDSSQAVMMDGSKHPAVSQLNKMRCAGSVTTAKGGGDFVVDGVRIGASSLMDYITANYEASVINLSTPGVMTFERKDDLLDLPGNPGTQLVVDNVVIGSSDLIPWFLINPNNNNVRIKTNGNLKISIGTIPGAPPGIKTFEAFPADLFTGEAVVLDWAADGMDYCAGLDDFQLGATTGDLPTRGTAVFTERRVGKRTYTLACYGAQVHKRSVTVNVTNGPGGQSAGIQFFVASNTKPLVGESFRLEWGTIDLSLCEGTKRWSGEKADSGHEDIQFNSSGVKQFTLTCENAAGDLFSETTQVTVTETVVGNAVQITSFSATPNPVEVGKTIKLNWTTANAKNCKGVSPADPTWTTSLLSSGFLTIRIDQPFSGEYVLRCFEDGSTGDFVEAAVHVVSVGEPDLPVTTTLSVDKQQIVEGESVDFTWASTNATNCETLGVATGWAGMDLSSSGSMSFIPQHDSMSALYTIRCFNVTQSAADSVEIYSALPAQALGGNNCPQPNQEMVNAGWQEVWVDKWPGPNGLNQVLWLHQGQNLAIKFKTSTNATGTISSAPSVGTPGVRTMTLSKCPGDYTFGEQGDGVELMDADCTQTWGVGDELQYETNNTYVPGNGVCELKKGKVYYMNIRFSSACTGSRCYGVFDYSRTDN